MKPPLNPQWYFLHQNNRLHQRLRLNLKQKTTKVSRTLPVTPVTTKGSKLPKRIETPPSVSPEELTHAYMMETPPDSKRKPYKRRKAQTPVVAR